VRIHSHNKTALLIHAALFADESAPTSRIITMLRSEKISSLSQIQVAVVTRNGQHTIRDTLNALGCSVKEQNILKILVIDNGSDDNTPDVVNSMRLPNLEVLAQKDNEGVAKAYNLALNKTVENQIPWLLLLDQDSCFFKGSLDTLVQAAQNMADKGHRIGAACPQAHCKNFPEVIHYPLKWTGKKFESIVTNDLTDPIFIDSSITSGTLYNVSALKQAGGFRENFFIDFVDHECHWRMRKSGWKIVHVKNAAIYHNLGKIQKMTENGLWVEHEPYRYYYMARNMLRGCWEMGGLQAVSAMMTEIYRHSLKIIKHGSCPSKSLFYIIKGTGHALMGKMGRL
jgi:rhamnosyltransferase